MQAAVQRVSSLPVGKPLCNSRSLGSRARSRSAAVAASTSGSAPTPQQQDAASLDVSGAVVQPTFRSTPWEPQAAANGGSGAASARGSAARIALVSESGVCRCVLAAAALERALQQRGLTDLFECECRSSRDYCLGEGPDPSAAAVAEELEWQLPAGYRAEQFEEARDIVAFDLVLVVDKFVAADVLREVSIFDTISTWGKGNYSSKVRRLGEFASLEAAATSGSGSNPDAADILDPLYGNVEAEAELEAVRSAAACIQESCEGLADFLASVAAKHREEEAALACKSSEGEASGDGQEGAEQLSLSSRLTAAVRELGEIAWLVPPMLAPR